jgi:hypothetical protein
VWALNRTNLYFPGGGVLPRYGSMRRIITATNYSVDASYQTAAKARQHAGKLDRKHQHHGALRAKRSAALPCSPIADGSKTHRTSLPWLMAHCRHLHQSGRTDKVETPNMKHEHTRVATTACLGRLNAESGIALGFSSSPLTL